MRENVRFQIARFKEISTMLLHRVAAVTDPFGSITDHLDRQFNAAISGLMNSGVSGVPSVKAFPALNMWEDDGSLRLEAELPGWERAQLDIFVLGRDLTIKGERGEASDEASSDAYLRRERFHGSFERTVRLPVAIAADGIDAVLKDGVLTISLPKAAEAKPRRIAVRMHNA
jgi:HSP20 family protein